MKKIEIQKNDAGSRFDKYLKKLFVKASGGFIYKMLRKKNITLNGAKSDGREILKAGDCVEVFISDETFAKFTQSGQEKKSKLDFYRHIQVPKLDIIYEDNDLLLINKPANLLSQKANATDISANEILIAYMVQNRMLDEETFATFHPSVCNRLDQNTTGILTFGKSKSGVQLLSKALKERSAHKYYYAIVKGKFAQNGIFEGYLYKDELRTVVTISKDPREQADPIKTGFQLKAYDPSQDLSLIEIELFTGKTHQIRAHLAQIGHPIIGDYKYGERSVNDVYKRKYGVQSQLLHAYKLELADVGTYLAPLPETFLQFFPDIK